MSSSKEKPLTKQQLRDITLDLCQTGHVFVHADHEEFLRQYLKDIRVSFIEVCGEDFIRIELEKR